MANIRQSIISTLYNDFQKITTNNGYNNTVEYVYKKLVHPDEVKTFPSIYFTFGNAISEFLSEGQDTLLTTLEIQISANVNIPNNDSALNATLTDKTESIIQDVKSLINGYKTNSTVIGDIEGVEQYFISSVEQYYLDDKNTKGGAIIKLVIVFLENEQLEAIDVTASSVPTLTTPSNGGTSTSLNTLFDWTANSTDLFYHIQVATDSGFNNKIIDQNNILYTSYSIPNDAILTDATVYYWRVRASNQYGYSNWTSTFSFTTNSSTTPAAPTLQSPISVTSTLSATDFHWNVSTNSTSYDIIVSSASNFSVTSFSSSTINATTITANLSANGTYYWKVRGRNSGVGNYSSTASFVRNADAQDYRTNLLVNWVADTNVSSSAGLVSQWVDTISGLTASQTGANSLRPLLNTNQLNGHDVIQIISNVPYMTFPATQFGTYTIFAVVNPSVHTSGDGNVLLGGTAGDIYTSLRLVGAGFGTGDGSKLRNSVFTGSLTSTGWGIYTFQASKIYKNNVEPSYVYTQTPSTLTLNVIGARNTSKIFPWFGQIAEIRIYNAVLDATNIGIVNNYLNNKYAIY